MTIQPRPPADVPIDATLVRALLREQHADLATLPLVDAGEGWDNRLFRLGDALAVRIPRRAASAALIEHEQRWLPQLAARLPLPVPAAARLGRPGCGYPWSWSITAWLPGRTALATPPANPLESAAVLGRFLAALHQPAPADAPRNPWRGVPLAARTTNVHDHLERLGGTVDRAAVLEVWAQALSVAPWAGPPLWIHGDVHPGNLLVADGRLSAVIDFGDLTAGDPATDLSVLWMVLPPGARSVFVDAARSEFNPIDAATLMRARAWALALGLAYAAHAQDDPALARLGDATIAAALNDDQPWSTLSG